MRQIILAGLFVFLAGTASGQEDPFAPTNPTAATRAADGPAHPDADDPKAREIILTHTSSLPECDRVVIYSLKEVKPFEKREKPPQEKAFPIRPYGTDAEILDRKTLSKREAESLARRWRSLTFDRWASAFCHYPVYGLRFYRGDDLLLETSLCWACSNFYLPEKEPSEDVALAKGDYQWYGFRKDQVSNELLQVLKKILPHPQLQKK